MRYLFWIVSLLIMWAGAAWAQLQPGNILILIGVAILVKALFWRRSN